LLSVIGGIVVLVVALPVVCNVCSNTGNSLSGSFGTTTANVKYEVEGRGTSTASMTYSSAGGTQQDGDKYLPWSHSFTAGSGHHLYISAQNQSRGGGLTVRILVNGTERKTANCSGPYCIASSSDLL
jgi:hypothetical protein